MPSTTTKTLAKGTFWGLLAMFFLKFIGWFYYIILARLVSPEEVSLFFLGFSIVSIATIFSDLGMGPVSMWRYIPFYAGRGEYNHVRKVTAVALVAGTVFSIVCMILLIVFAWDIASLFNKPELTPRLVPVIQIMAWYLLAYNFYSIVTGFLGGRKLTKYSSYVNSLQGLIKVVLTLVFLFLLGYSAGSISLGFVLSFFLASAIGIRWMIREYRKLPKSEEHVDNPRLLHEMVSYGVVIMALSSVSMLITYLDRIMLEYFIPDPTVVGIYSIAIGFTAVLSVFSTPIGSIFSPVITEFLGAKNFQEIETTCSTCLRWMIMSTTPIFLVIILFSKELLTAVYGAQYGSGSVALIIYAAGLFIFSFSSPVQGVLSAMRRLDVSARIVFLGTVVNIILNLFLIPVCGMNGSALASAFSLFFMALLFLNIGKTVYFRMPKDIYKPVLAGALTLMIVAVLKPFITVFSGDILNVIINISPSSDLLGAVIKVCILGVFSLAVGLVYLVFLIILRSFAEEDVTLISGGMRRAGLPPNFVNLVKRVISG